MTTQIDLYNETNEAYKEFLRTCCKIKNNQACEQNVKEAIDDMLTLADEGLADVLFTARHEDLITGRGEDDGEDEPLTGHEMGVITGRI